MYTFPDMLILMRKKQNSEKQLRERLKRLRENLRMTQKELAKEFYVTTGAINHWESGKRTIPGPAKKLIEVYEKILVSRRERDGDI